MCEPLQGKKKNPIDEFNIDVPTAFYEECYMFDAKDIKSAVNFYKKYRNRFPTFKKDYPDIAEKINGIWTEHDPDFSFNNWLFNYTFKDAIE